jgi:tRNA (guanine-N7-)-methyltransferase
LTDPLELGRLYGRRKGPKLRDRPARLIAELLPQVALPETGALSRERLFPAGGIDALWLEVGFGKGEHLMSLAKSHPRIGFIGCEPFVNGMAACLGKLEDEGLGNVRLHMGDALDVITRLPDASVERLFVLHPDPWPKARHAKRRFINPGPLAQIARVLVPGGELRVGTDHPIHMAGRVGRRLGTAPGRLARDPLRSLEFGRRPPGLVPALPAPCGSACGR